VSLKVVLIHNGNRFPSFPLAHSVNTKESYDRLKYDEYKSKLCGGLKVMALLLGMQTSAHNILLFPVPVGQPGQESPCKYIVA